MVRENGKWKGRIKQDFERPEELLLKTTLKNKVRKENVKKQGVAQDLDSTVCRCNLGANCPLKKQNKTWLKGSNHHCKQLQRADPIWFIHSLEFIHKFWAQSL